MKHNKASLAAAALLVGAVSLVGATSASADFSPQARDIVGVGSDTIQIALNNVADGAKIGAFNTPGYNATNGARLVSFNALNPSVPSNSATTLIHDQIVVKPGATPITRPDGSGAGMLTLYGTGNVAGINYSRSSSALDAPAVAGGLTAISFGVDTLGVAVSTTTNAPAGVSLAQLVNIYKGITTDWSQIGGQSGTIVPLIPQAGSGTRKFFEAQLKAANGGVTVVYPANLVVEVQEHDPLAFDATTAAALTQPYNAANAVGPFSIGRAALGAGPASVHIDTALASDSSASFSAQRAVYNIVRTADMTKAFVTNLFGPNGFLCSPAAKDLISAGGVSQMATAGAGGACGTTTNTTTGITNFTLS